MMPPYVSVVPPATWNVPPPAFSVMPRLAFSVKLAVVCNVPPLNVSCPAVAAPGAVPRFKSCEMLTVPPLMFVAPV